jgi:LacI family transcriptional regulator
MSGSAGGLPRPARPTMRDVAALARVSLKTVSRVVNDEPGVKPEVRARVQEAASRLDYRPNLTASNLRRSSGRTRTLGALLQDLSNSFSAALLRSLEDMARERGVALLAASLDEDADRERTLVADLVARRVDGLVLMPATDRQDYLLAELRAGLPTVFVDRPPRGVDADSVTVDNAGGAGAATRHLVEHGHTRIAYLGDAAEIRTAADRLAGYLQAMQDSGVPVPEDLVRSGLRTPEAAEQEVVRLLSLPDPPTAVFTSRNTVSVGAVRALRRTGRQHEVAMVGFDDFPLADLLEPALTVVRQDVGRIGASVGELLFRRLDGEAGAPRSVVIAPTLVVRGSGELPPAR